MDFKKLHVAYFSMEIGIREQLPTYSGGLGVLAGDTLRSMADLEVPVVGITLIYKKGYFRQTLDEWGNQIETPVDWQPEKLLKKLDKKVVVKVEGRDVHVGAWLYEHKGVSGHVNPIIFLDTDLDENSEWDRTITDELYGRDRHYRLAQEVILGIGGLRMVNELGCENINRYHMNEGHSALLTLELCRLAKDRNEHMHEVRERCVFTTHTPVPAGHDQFDKDLVMSMISDMIPPDIEKHIFIDNKLNMTYLGLRYSEFINGVAKKHGEVSRDMFPGYHIESITNGVHTSFWASHILFFGIPSIYLRLNGSILQPGIYSSKSIWNGCDVQNEVCTPFVIDSI
jgi:starch phosphorylase